MYSSVPLLALAIDRLRGPSETLCNCPFWNTLFPYWLLNIVLSCMFSEGSEQKLSFPLMIVWSGSSCLLFNCTITGPQRNPEFSKSDETTYKDNMTSLETRGTIQYFTIQLPLCCLYCCSYILLPNSLLLFFSCTVAGRMCHIDLSYSCFECAVYSYLQSIVSGPHGPQCCSRWGVLDPTHMSYENVWYQIGFKI